MASTNVHQNEVVEPCPACGKRQPHDVSIALLTESDREENAEFSREPYRISECHGCGERSETRMNDV